MTHEVHLYYISHLQIGLQVREESVHWNTVDFTFVTIIVLLYFSLLKVEIRLRFFSKFTLLNSLYISLL